MVLDRLSSDNPLPTGRTKMPTAYNDLGLVHFIPFTSAILKTYFNRILWVLSSKLVIALASLEFIRLGAKGQETGGP